MTSWNIEKYAHQSNDNWVQVDKRNGAIKLILQGSLLLVIQDETALESVALIHTNCRGLAKGSTILFLVTSITKQQPSTQKKVRKFRVKFSADNGRSAEEQKASCITALQGFMTIYNTDAGKQGDKLLNITPLKEIAWNLLDKSDVNKLPGWESIKASQEEEKSLERAIKLCLLDPSFPTLVQRVEEKLSGASSTKKSK
ncbi:uncharacterized protein LOC124169287 [Ischnura elegans]|uniref:uncharacterized protein LOC124169287 n=1 Tax=Ischnura elegans TaxID=197161 RepID=UPI001ED8879D|nr:uncharacterized protein LOC124169287 [Ischnura elegans]